MTKTDLDRMAGDACDLWVQHYEAHRRSTERAQQFMMYGASVAVIVLAGIAGDAASIVRHSPLSPVDARFLLSLSEIGFSIILVSMVLLRFYCRRRTAAIENIQTKYRFCASVLRSSYKGDEESLQSVTTYESFVTGFHDGYYMSEEAHLLLLRLARECERFGVRIRWLIRLVVFLVIASLLLLLLAYRGLRIGW